MKHVTFEKYKLQLSEDKLDFHHARNHAGLTVAEYLKDPMLIAWYDGMNRKEYPEVPECQSKPGWIAYAEGHGGKMLVDVNHGKFMFIYADTENMD